MKTTHKTLVYAVQDAYGYYLQFTGNLRSIQGGKTPDDGDLFSTKKEAEEKASIARDGRVVECAIM